MIAVGKRGEDRDNFFAGARCFREEVRPLRTPDLQAKDLCRPDRPGSQAIHHAECDRHYHGLPVYLHPRPFRPVMLGPERGARGAYGGGFIGFPGRFSDSSLEQLRGDLQLSGAPLDPAGVEGPHGKSAPLQSCTHSTLVSKNLVVIVVDARTNPKTNIDTTPRSLRLPTIVDTIASVPMGNYSFDTVQELTSTFKQWGRDLRSYSACERILDRACPGAKMPHNPPESIDTMQSMWASTRSKMRRFGTNS